MLDRSVKPTSNGEIIFSPPIVKKHKLSNKLNLLFVQKDTLPIVQVNLIISAGSIFDSDKNGLAYLTSMLIDEGAGDLDGLEIADRIEILGSILDINCNKENITFSLLSLKENLEKSLDILTLILLQPTFNEKNFKREHQKLLTKILQLNDDPSFVASKEFNRTLLFESAYQEVSVGTIDSVTSLTNNDVRNFYETNFTPNNSTLVIVGNLDFDEAKKISEKYLSKWEEKKSTTNDFCKFITAEKQLLLINKPNADQSEIRVGHLSQERKSEDFYARTILNSILGGQFSSRINLNLREDKGYTYGAHSNFIYNKFLSTFVISTSVKSEFTGNAISEIIKELRNASSTLTHEELDFAKSFLIRRYPSLFETYSQISTNVSLLATFNLPDNYFSSYIDSIEKVKLNEVSDAAEKNIKLDELVITVVGDINKIKSQITELDSFKIIEKEKSI